jgi:hypothetical protein
LAGEVFPDDFQTTEAQIYEAMAAAIGIDLSDETDPIAQLVRTGIADINPERVMRDCQHLSVRLGSGGIVADGLRLPTAGSKILRCAIHGHGIGSMSLDRAHQAFKTRYCDQCAERSPRPVGWVWVPEVDEEPT